MLAIWKSKIKALSSHLIYLQLLLKPEGSDTAKQLPLTPHPTGAAASLTAREIKPG